MAAERSAGPVTVAVLVGRPTEHTSPSGRPVRTAIRKAVVDGPVAVGATNLAGDEQADLRVHGGPDKAVLACSADHGPSWTALDPALAAPGALGENLHVSGLTESDVCIGDRWNVGSALFEVSQPRQPCWKVNDRWGRDDLVDHIEATGHGGWYLRVVEEGSVSAGDAWDLASRPHPDWTVDAANDVMHHRRGDLAAARSLDAVAELADSWHRTLAKRIDRLSAGHDDDADQSPRRSGGVA